MLRVIGTMIAHIHLDNSHKTSRDWEAKKVARETAETLAKVAEYEKRLAKASVRCF
jgi:hypothetical protein